MLHDDERVGPKAMPRLRSALRHSRFLVFSVALLTSTECCLCFSAPRIDGLTRLSTLSSPRALLKILPDASVGSGLGGGRTGPAFMHAVKT